MKANLIEFLKTKLPYIEDTRATSAIIALATGENLMSDYYTIYAINGSEKRVITSNIKGRQAANTILLSWRKVLPDQQVTLEKIQHNDFKGAA